MSSKRASSICVLPWIQLHITPEGNVTPCCISTHSVMGNVKHQSLESIWNGDSYKDIRAKMIDGERHPACKSCYEQEDLGLFSTRNEYNKTFPTDLNNLLKLPEDASSVATTSFKFFDIRFSNICNFKCRGCAPLLSSAWYEDEIALTGKVPHNPKLQRLKSDAKDFWSTLPQLVNELEYVYIAGGEPLLMRENFELLELLISKGKTDLRLYYNTNLSTLKFEGNNLINYWKLFKQVDLCVSVDDIGPRAEYFRHGTIWKTIEENLLAVRDIGPNIRTSVNCTVNAMNIYHLPELYEHLLSNKLTNSGNILLNLLQDPANLSITILPKATKAKVQHKLLSYADKLSSANLHGPAADIKRMVEAMMRKDDSHLFTSFLDYTRSLDKIRNENFEQTYPEFAAILT